MLRLNFGRYLPGKIHEERIEDLSEKLNSKRDIKMRGGKTVIYAEVLTEFVEIVGTAGG